MNDYIRCKDCKYQTKHTKTVHCTYGDVKVTDYKCKINQYIINALGCSRGERNDKRTDKRTA